MGKENKNIDSKKYFPTAVVFYNKKNNKYSLLNFQRSILLKSDYVNEYYLFRAISRNLKNFDETLEIYNVSINLVLYYDRTIKFYNQLIIIVFIAKME